MEWGASRILALRKHASMTQAQFAQWLGVSIKQVKYLEHQRRNPSGPTRRLLGILAQIAFALAAIGIYGVISCDVSQRTREIGIRAALGARPATLFGMILKQAGILAACGIAVGVAAAFALTRLMKDMLYQTGPADAWTFTAAPLLLAAVALLACCIPARRAMALDPSTALRHE